MHQQSETRRFQETKSSSEMKQKCTSLEHKVTEVERKNARLERQLVDLNIEYEKASRTAESYRTHYQQVRDKKLPPISLLFKTMFPNSSSFFFLKINYRIAV